MISSMIFIDKQTTRSFTGASSWAPPAAVLLVAAWWKRSVWFDDIVSKQHVALLWPLSPTSAPTWAALSLVMFMVWIRSFWLDSAESSATKGLHAEKKKKTEEMMTCLLAFEEEQDAAVAKQPKTKSDMPKLPESSRVLELLWDDTHEQLTSVYGVDPKLTSRTQKLLRRTLCRELTRAVDITQEARDIRYGDETGNKDKSGVSIREMKFSHDEHNDYETGEKLAEVIEQLSVIKRNLGDGYTDEAQVSRALELRNAVLVAQRKNMGRIVSMILPVLPTLIYVFCSTIFLHVFYSYFHQIGIWALAAEYGAAGKSEMMQRQLFEIWLGHVLIKFFEMVECSFENRARALLGQSVRNGVLSALMRQDYGYFDKTSPGILQDRLNKDADELGESIISYPKRLCSRLTFVASSLYLVWCQCPGPLFVVAAAPVVFMIVFQYYMFKRFRRSEEKQRKIRESTLARTSEILKEVKTVRQFAQELEETATYRRRERTRHTLVEAEYVTKRTMETVCWTIFDSSLVFVMLAGMSYVTAGEISASQLVDIWAKLSFNICFCLRELIEMIPYAVKLLHPLGRICDLLDAKPQIEPVPSTSDTAAQVIVQKDTPAEVSQLLHNDCSVIQTGNDRAVIKRKADGAELVAIESLPEHDCLSSSSFTNITSQSEVDGLISQVSKLVFPIQVTFSTKVRPTKFRGSIEFRNVHFEYPTDLRVPVLRGFNLQVEAGQKVALVGATGCGKSTTMSLLQQLYTPSQGEIFLDGRNLKEYDVHHLRSRVVIVDQTTVLFNRSIRDNIAYGCPDVTDEDIIDACKKAAVWDFICEKPDKLLTLIQEGGKNLSGGQRQRLAIARALVRKPDVILLDEATAALDNSNEKKVMDALMNSNATILIIAHRLSTIKDCDNIVLIDHGRKIEEGTHEQLLSRKVSEDVDHLTPAVKLMPLNLVRNGTEPVKLPSFTSEVGSKDRPSYKKLWEAATGKTEKKLSMSEMLDKIQASEAELRSLRARVSAMQAVKRSLTTDAAALRNDTAGLSPLSFRKERSWPLKC